MTPEQIELVQSTWERVAPAGDQIANMCFTRLFEIAPELKPLFTSDMAEQGEKLSHMLTLVIASLSDFDEIVPAVRELGVRHAEYQVEPEHYEFLKTALLWSLEQGLGDKFTPAVEQAWSETYVSLSTVMKEAAAALA